MVTKTQHLVADAAWLYFLVKIYELLEPLPTWEWLVLPYQVLPYQALGWSCHCLEALNSHIGRDFSKFTWFFQIFTWNWPPWDAKTPHFQSFSKGHQVVKLAFSLPSWFFADPPKTEKTYGENPENTQNQRGGRYMGVSKNRCTPKSSILIGFSIINHPFWGTIIFGNIHISSHSQQELNFTHQHIRAFWQTCPQSLEFWHMSQCYHRESPFSLPFFAYKIERPFLQQPEDADCYCQLFSARWWKAIAFWIVA